MNALWSKPATFPAAEHVPNAEVLTPAQARVRNPGRRFAQIVKLKPEYYDKYKEVHAAVWPEVLKQIKNCNIVDCTYTQAFFYMSYPEASGEAYGHRKNGGNGLA